MNFTKQNVVFDQLLIPKDTGRGYFLFEYEIFYRPCLVIVIDQKHILFIESNEISQK